MLVRRAHRRMATKIGLFTLNAAIAVILPLIILNLVVVSEGVGVYGQVAIAQSAGSIAAIIITYGWAVAGPPAIARADRVERVNIYVQSLSARAWLFVVVCFLAGAVSLFTGQLSSLVILAFVNAASAAMSPNWYYVGAGEAKSLIIYDTLPRVGASAIGAILGFWWTSPGIVLFLQLVGSVLAPVIASRRILRHYSRRGNEYSLIYLRQTLVQHRTAAATSGVAALYVSLPIPLLGLTNIGAVPAFAAAQRVERLGLALSKPATEVMQSWVPDTDKGSHLQRVESAIRVGMWVGIGSSFLVILASGPLIAYASGNRIVVSMMSRILVGLTVGFIAWSQIIGLVCLASMGKLSAVLKSTIYGALVGVTGLMVFSLPLGSAGAWLALLLSEATVVSYQLRYCRMVLRENLEGL